MLHGSGNFDLVYEVVAPHISLGGVSNKTNYSFDFSLSNYPANKSLLDIVVALKNLDIRKWKVELSGVALTREFKPQICKRYSQGYICKFLFDVTPIIRSKPSKKYRVNIIYPEMRELMLLHLGFFVLVNENKADTRYVYLSEPIVLGPQESINFKLPFRFSNAHIKMTLSIPHASATLILESQSRKTKISGYQGAIEYMNSIGATESISLYHKGSGAYFPKEIIVPSILIYETNAPKPRINVTINKLKESKVEVKLINEGDAKASNVIVVNISVGNIVDRKIISEIASGEEKSVIININPNYLNTIRVIWKFKDETYIVEKKVKN